MTLLVAGVAIFALLLTSYSQRGAWVASGSTTLSLAAFMGLLLVPTVQDPVRFQAHLANLVRQLPLELDQKTLEALAAAIAPATSCPATNAPGCTTAKAMGPPIVDEGVVPRPASPVSPDEAQAGATGMGSESTSIDASASPIIWLLDSPGAATPPAARFLISGINRSNQPLQKVRATLKPDATEREIVLTLNLLGRDVGDVVDVGDEAVIPPGAKFALGLEIQTPNMRRIGGAVFAFRYVYAGRQRNVIWYFTPTMVARLGPSG